MSLKPGLVGEATLIEEEKWKGGGRPLKRGKSGKWLREIRKNSLFMGDHFFLSEVVSIME